MEGMFVCGRLYGKLRYVNKIDYLLKLTRRNEDEISKFAIDPIEDLEYCSIIDYK